jgi:putative phage-type endonuclease
MNNSTEVIQGSDEWFALRLGKVTASKVADVMSKGTGRATYMDDLLAERMSGQSKPSFTNDAMRWGTEQEPYARQAYEVDQECFVEETGFWQHDELALGVSPDGLVGGNGVVGEDGLVEIKCPNSSTHVGWLRAKKVPAKHIKQIQCQLWVTGRSWCDFVSFDPRMIEAKNRLMVVRCERDDALITKMELEVRKFLTELDGWTKGESDD